MEDLSEKAIQENCPHCDLASQAYRHQLDATKHFRIVADVHPLIAGHILIIPQQHVSCVGEYPDDLFREFITIYKKVSEFIERVYSSISSFEHGKIGQTVFHSHVHLLPFSGDVAAIIPEGQDRLKALGTISELKNSYEQNGQYLFFSIGDNKWTVDSALAQPGFFRHRFANAIGNPERGDWKKMHVNQKLMSIADQENKEVANHWRRDQPLAGLVPAKL